MPPSPSTRRIRYRPIVGGNGRDSAESTDDPVAPVWVIPAESSAAEGGRASAGITSAPFDLLRSEQRSGYPRSAADATQVCSRHRSHPAGGPSSRSPERRAHVDVIA